MSKYSNKNNSVEEAFSILLSEIEKKNLKVKIEPEKKYVRRSAEEFQKGAKPVTGGSHRFQRINVSLNPDVKAVAEFLADKQGINLSEWIRAAMRKALREGMDAKWELSETVELTDPPSGTDGPA